MRIRGKILGFLLGGISLSMQAGATTVRQNAGGRNIGASSNPYGVIVQRNVFDLKDPPPPPPKEDTNPPPPNVELTGIMTIFGHRQALFMVQDAAVPGKPPKSAESYILTEGQRQGVLQVLEIDEKNSRVKIKNDGIVSTITFEKPKSDSSNPGRDPRRNMMGGQFSPFSGQRSRPGFNPGSSPYPLPSPLQTGKRFPRPG